MPFDKVQQLQNWLKQQSEVDVAILFGSYATGSFSAKSDIDVALQLASGLPLTAQQKLDYIGQLGKALLLDIDLIDLALVGQPLLSQIIKYGKMLKGSRTQYAELAIKNINTTQDFMPYIERMMSERRARLLSNG